MLFSLKKCCFRFDKQSNVESKVKYVTEDECNRKLSVLEKVFEEKLKTAMEIMENKDKLISQLSMKVGKLESDVEQLKKSSNFLTQETTDLKNGAEKLKEEGKNTSFRLNNVVEKTIDLEDRSRRDNIVVFGIPETLSENQPENTEMLLTKIFQKHGLIDRDHDLDHDPVFHRVHRLGPKKSDNNKPRPIICKCVYFKDRQLFVYNSGKLKGTNINIAEDYSKPTLNIRRQLVQNAKAAKDTNQNIDSFKVNIKRLVIKYINEAFKQTFFRGFNLEDIIGNPNWHNSPTRSNPKVRGMGYQDY